MYPLIFRPESGHYLIKGFAFVYEKMLEATPTDPQSFEIW
jgi:hypothetical protein